MPRSEDEQDLSLISTAALEEALLPILSPIHVPFQNWAKTFKSDPTKTYLPTTPHQVRLIVELCRRTKQTLRARGSGHSPSDLVCTDGVMIDLRGLNQVLSVKEEAGERGGAEVEVEAGIVLKDLNRELAERGYGLTSLGSISDQTISGAISTATHGSSVIYGNLSTTISFLDIVLPHPGTPIVRVSRSENPDIYKAALCGLGAIGVIVRLGVVVEKRFRLEEECSTVTIQEFVAKWQEIAESAEHVRTWWFPQVGEVKISRMRRTTKALTTPPSKLYTFFFDNVLATHLHAVLLLLSKPFPRLLPWNANLIYALVHRPAPISTSRLMSWLPGLPGVRIWKSKAGNKVGMGLVVGNSEAVVVDEKVSGLAPLPGVQLLTPPTIRVDWSENIFNYDCGFPQYTYEGSIPYKSTIATLTALQEWYDTELSKPSGLRTHFPVEVRWTEGDDIWLSPTYGDYENESERIEGGKAGRASYIGIIQYRPYGLPVPHRKIFSQFSSILTRFSGRPHWAKSHTFSLSQLKELYPKLDDWLEVRKQVDPEQVLVNEYLKRHLVAAA